MRLLAWGLVGSFLIASASLFADDAAELKKADLPVDPKDLTAFFQKRLSEKGRKPMSPQVVSAAVRSLAVSKDPDRFKALWNYAVTGADVVEQEEICATLSLLDRRQTEPRFLLAQLSSADPASVELAAYAVARYFEPRYRSDALRVSRSGAATGLMGPQFLKEIREAQAPAKDILIKAGVAQADDFQPERLEKAPTLPGMEYLKRRTPSPLETTAIKAAIGKLGDADFREREKATTQLCMAGEPAIPFLRSFENADDAEVRLRARRCLNEIDRRQIPDGTLAALRVIAWNASPVNSDAALRQLLDYAPFVESKDVEDVLLSAVAYLCIRTGGVPALVDEAQNSELPSRRALAVWVRGKIDEYAAKTCPGCDDAHPSVRLRAAQGLVLNESRDGVDRLIRLIPTIEPRYHADIENVLIPLAGDGAPNLRLANASAAQLVKARDAWLTWYAKHGATTDISSLRRDQPFEGLITICENEVGVPKAGGGSRVWQRGRDGKERWSIGNFQGATCCDVLRNGNVLVGEPRTRRIVERDPKGTDVWQFPINGQPIKVQRLASGNTFVATNNQFFEITPDKNTVNSHTLPPGTFMYSVDRTSDGRIVCMTSRGSIVEYDVKTGAEIRSIPFQAATTGMTAVHAYAKDRYLVAIPNQNNGLVMEIDGLGKTLWQANFKGAFRAIKLPSGNVVVASYSDRKFAEIDRDGRIVWESACAGQPTGLAAR